MDNKSLNDTAKLKQDAMCDDTCDTCSWFSVILMCFIS